MNVTEHPIMNKNKIFPDIRNYLQWRQQLKRSYSVRFRMTVTVCIDWKILVRHANVFFLFLFKWAQNYIYPGKLNDDVMSFTFSENDKNETAHSQPILNGKGNGTIYQNGHTKSDVAVIDISDDGKFFSFFVFQSIYESRSI